jgi:beta-glucanase (GH16 family)
MSVRALALPAALLVLACGPEKNETLVSPPPAWQLTFSDEFDGPKGESPDRSRWGFDVGGGGFGNAQLEFNTDRPSNASLDGNGNLAIVARIESYMGNRFTSARLKTQSKFAQRYGRIEARIKLPVGQGIWPAFWMLGDDIDEVGWPQTGEIDIMEYRGQEPKLIHGSLHGPGYSGASPITTTYRHKGDEGLDADYHVFAVDWDPSRITWWIDDEVYQSVGSPAVRARGEWVFDHPFFILLNVAVGGNFVGAPDATTLFPQTMLVDYVRVFERI